MPLHDNNNWVYNDNRSALFSLTSSKHIQWWTFIYDHIKTVGNPLKSPDKLTEQLNTMIHNSSFLTFSDNKIFTSAWQIQSITIDFKWKSACPLLNVTAWLKIHRKTKTKTLFSQHFPLKWWNNFFPLRLTTHCLWKNNNSLIYKKYVLTSSFQSCSRTPVKAQVLVQVCHSSDR